MLIGRVAWRIGDCWWRSHEIGFCRVNKATWWGSRWGQSRIRAELMSWLGAKDVILQRRSVSVMWGGNKSYGICHIKSKSLSSRKLTWASITNFSTWPMWYPSCSWRRTMVRKCQKMWSETPRMRYERWAETKPPYPEHQRLRDNWGQMRKVKDIPHDRRGWTSEKFQVHPNPYPTNTPIIDCLAQRCAIYTKHAPPIIISHKANCS